MNVLPTLFDDRKHNLEFYAQKQVFKKLDLLNKLPINQNVSGNFVNFEPTPDMLGDVITTSEGIDFNEIQFGEPSAIRGATIPKGFMFKMSTRLEDKSRFDSTLQIFTNKAVNRLVNFYDGLFIDSLSAGAGATAPVYSSLTVIDSSATGVDVLSNELKIIDAMEYKNGVDTGFTPSVAYVNRADKLAIDIALAKSDLIDDANFQYIGTNKVTSGHYVVCDMENPVATVEKYADPRYSVFAQYESESDWNDDYAQAEIPPSFINIKMAEPDEPQRNYVYIFAEAGLNILEPNGIMNVSFSA